MPNEDLPFGKPGQSDGKLSCTVLGGGEGEVTPITYGVYYAVVDYVVFNVHSFFTQLQ